MSRHDRFFNLLSDIGYYLGIVPDATRYEINRILEIYRKVDLYSGNFDYLDRYYKFMIPQLELYLKQLKSQVQIAA